MPTNKTPIRIVWITLAGLLAFHAAFAKKGGTNILHYMVKTMMQANAVYDADAQGRIDLKIRQQGNADQQSLRIRLSNLESNSTYTLLAALSGESNLTEVVSFDTDAKGQAVLDYANHGNGNGRGHGALPAELNPLIDVLDLSIVNGSTQTVLSANLEDGQVLQYLVKRTMDNDGVEPDAFAILRIKASNQQQQFSIQASGLSSNTDYQLVINDAVLAAHTADAGGKLQINSLPGGAPSVLDITNVVLWNSVSNSVLSTTLP